MKVAVDEVSTQPETVSEEGSNEVYETVENGSSARRHSFTGSATVFSVPPPESRVKYFHLPANNMHVSVC